MLLSETGVLFTFIIHLFSNIDDISSRVDPYYSRIHYLTVGVYLCEEANPYMKLNSVSISCSHAVSWRSQRCSDVNCRSFISGFFLRGGVEGGGGLWKQAHTVNTFKFIIFIQTGRPRSRPEELEAKLRNEENKKQGHEAQTCSGDTYMSAQWDSRNIRYNHLHTQAASHRVYGTRLTHKQY